MLRRTLLLASALLTLNAPLSFSEELTELASAKDLKKQIEEAAEPVKKAVTKTAKTAAEEAQKAMIGAHTIGGRFLQGLINIMIAASPGKTRVYLPAPSSDPNSGVTVGVLPVFLFVGQKEQVRHILAPSLTYNRTFDVTGTMRWYWYPHQDAKLTMIGSYSLETNRRFTFRYEDPTFLSDRFYFKSEYNLLQDGSYRFFGLGPNSAFQDQSNYTLKDDHLQLFTGINLWKNFRATLSHRIRSSDVVNGPISSLPKITDFSPRPDGVENKKFMIAQRLSFTYDSRDLTMAPVRGHFLDVFVERSGHLGGDAKYTRLGLDLRGFYPLKEDRFITGFRFLAEGEDGANVPFYEQELLGGKDSLRGYGDARFVDRCKNSISIEERMRLYTLNAFNVNVDFELTPFYEAGTVFPRPQSYQISELRHVAGVGFRSVVRPNVVGVIDLGFGDEGTALFVGIDYPF